MQVDTNFLGLDARGLPEVRTIGNAFINICYRLAPSVIIESYPANTSSITTSMILQEACERHHI